MSVNVGIVARVENLVFEQEALLFAKRSVASTFIVRSVSVPLTDIII
jgi:hypothetical protein